MNNDVLNQTYYISDFASIVVKSDQKIFNRLGLNIIRGTGTVAQLVKDPKNAARFKTKAYIPRQSSVFAFIRQLLYS